MRIIWLRKENALSPDPTVLMAMGMIVALLAGASIYTKHKIRQIDRRITEREAAEAADQTL